MSIKGRIKAFFGDLGSEVGEIHSSRAAEDRKENDLRSPRNAPRAWTKARWRALVMETGTAARRALGLELVEYVGGHIERSLDGGPDTVAPPRVPQMLRGTLFGFELMCAMFPEQTIAAGEALIDAADYEEGPELAARLPMLAAVAKRQAELDDRLIAISDEAASVGVVVPLPPAEAAARQRKADLHKHWEESERLSKLVRVDRGYPHMPAPEPK